MAPRRRTYPCTRHAGSVRSTHRGLDLNRRALSTVLTARDVQPQCDIRSVHRSLPSTRPPIRTESFTLSNSNSTRMTFVLVPDPVASLIEAVNRNDVEACQLAALECGVSAINQKESEMNATAALPVVGVDLSNSVFQLAVAYGSWP